MEAIRAGIKSALMDVELDGVREEEVSVDDMEEDSASSALEEEEDGTTAPVDLPETPTLKCVLTTLLKPNRSDGWLGLKVMPDERLLHSLLQQGGSVHVTRGRLAIAAHLLTIIQQTIEIAVSVCEA